MVEQNQANVLDALHRRHGRTNLSIIRCITLLKAVGM